MNDISKETIKKAAGGDSEAFEEIYKNFSSYVYSIAYNITGRREEGEEVTQDVFLSLYRNLWKFNFKSSLKTWIYRVTVNGSINSYRKRQRIKEINVEPAKLEYMAMAERGDSLFDRNIILKYMLKSLPVEQRVCIVLREIKGFSYKEIAVIVKTNLNTVKTRLKRAREKLIDLYDKEKFYEM